MTAATRKIAIVFGLLSCRASAAAISQFAHAVAPHTVLVHHDFLQTPDFQVDADNVIVLEDPEPTAWGNWSLVSATFKLIARAIALGKWDYFQLVSESCLPARPISAFEDYLLHLAPNAMLDMQPVRAGQPATVMNYGWRYLPRSGRLTRLARRAGLWWIGKHYTLQTVCGGHIKVPDARRGTVTGCVMRWVGRAVSTAFLARGVGAFPLGDVEECWVGSQWIGVSRAAAEQLIAQRARTPALEAHFRRCHIPDEAYLHTLVAHCRLARIYPANHVTFWDGGKFGPDQVTVADFSRIVAAGRFFVRKFSLDPRCPARHAMLMHLRSQASGTAAADATAAAPCQVSNA